MPKNKSHKGLLKRVRVTKSGLIKFHRAGGRHLKSVKSAQRIRYYRKPAYALAAEIGRLRTLLNRKVRSFESAQRAKQEKAEAAA